MIINQQPGTTISVSPDGYIVIRQPARNVRVAEVLITPANAEKVANALIALIKRAEHVELVHETGQTPWGKPSPAVTPMKGDR